jgi:hypothetical protein
MNYIPDIDPWDDDLEEITAHVIVTDFEIIRPGRWGHYAIERVKTTKSGHPDKRTKLGVLVDRYIRRVLKMSENRWTEGII